MAVLRTLLAFALLALASTAVAQETVPDLSAILGNVDLSAILANLPANLDVDTSESVCEGSDDHSYLVVVPPEVVAAAYVTWLGASRCTAMGLKPGECQLWFRVEPVNLHFRSRN